MFKTRLGKASGNEVSLPMAVLLELDGLSSPFQHKLLYDSMNWISCSCLYTLLSFLSLILRQLPKGYTKISIQGPPRFSTLPPSNKLPSNSNAWHYPSYISSHVTYFSHTTQLFLWTCYSHSDYHLVPKQNLSSLGWIWEITGRKCLCMRASLSLSAFSSSNTTSYRQSFSRFE